MKKFIDNPIVAKQNYCVPAVLQMVLEHHNVYGYNQDKIASQLCIIPDSDDVDHSEWGARIKNDTINNFFSCNNINLKEQYVPINQFMDNYFMCEKIKELISKNITIICGYNYTWLFGNQEDTYRHVSIIVDVDLDTDKILLLDPGPKDAGYKYVASDKLFYAIKAGKDGLWCITENT